MDGPHKRLIHTRNVRETDTKARAAKQGVTSNWTHRNTALFIFTICHLGSVEWTVSRPVCSDSSNRFQIHIKSIADRESENPEPVQVRFGKWIAPLGLLCKKSQTNCQTFSSPCSPNNFYAKHRGEIPTNYVSLTTGNKYTLTPKNSHFLQIACDILSR